MFSLLINEITSQPILFFPEFPDFKIGLFIQPDKFHIKIADLILLLLTILLEFSDFKLIFLVVAEVMPFEVLNL